MSADFFKSFLFAPRANADGREEYIRAGLPKSGRGVARIEPRTRRWYRGQHHGSAGTFSVKTVVRQAGKSELSLLVDRPTDLLNCASIDRSTKSRDSAKYFFRLLLEYNPEI